jgi:hypothetical protein
VNCTQTSNTLHNVKQTRVTYIEREKTNTIKNKRDPNHRIGKGARYMKQKVNIIL